MTQSLTGQQHATVLPEAGDAAPGGDLRATIIGCTAILLWAALALLTVQAAGIPPFELLALSFGVAALGGTTLLAIRGPAALAQLRQPLAPWLTAFIGIFFYHALYFFALSAAPAAGASLIAYLWPLLIVLAGRDLAGRTAAPAGILSGRCWGWPEPPAS